MLAHIKGQGPNIQNQRQARTAWWLQRRLKMLPVSTFQKYPRGFWRNHQCALVHGCRSRAILLNKDGTAAWRGACILTRR